MEKEFVPYELSLELKELGFDRECFGRYTKGWVGDSDLTFYTGCGYKNDIQDYPTNCVAPFWQQAFDWVREKYSIDSAVLPTYSTKYCYRLYEQQLKSKTQIYGNYMGKEYKNYEKAQLECLKELIKIVKKNHEIF